MRIARRRGSAAGLAAAFLLVAFGALAQAAGTLSIRSGSHVNTFRIEFADNDEDRARGLMFRHSLAPDAGMLFDFGQVAPISMWMKNTYIPLDMVFIRQDGTVARIAENTEPLSTRIISSEEAIRGVLEVPGGTAKRLGIKSGDVVEHPLFRHP